MSNTDKIATDEMVSSRSRFARLVVLIIWGALCAAIIPWCVYALVPNTLTEKFPLLDILAIGLSIVVGLGIFGLLLPRFFIRVAPNTLFLTQNLLASGDNVDVVYGPGFHLSFPWEGRNANGNISLEEATVIFDFEINLPDGQLKGSGAYWLRADHMNPIKYLRSVASVGEELIKLIVREIQACMADDQFRKQIVTTDTSVIADRLSTHLERVFVEKQHPIEQTNGVIITNAAVDKLSLSDELMRTLSAISEARAVLLGTATILGYNTPEAVNQALHDRRLTQQDVKEARRAFQQISGNMENVQRNEYDLSISGLSPEVAAAITAFMQSPAGIALASRAGGTGQRQQKGKK